MLSRLLKSPKPISSLRRLSLTTQKNVIFKSFAKAVPTPSGSFAQYMMKQMWKHYLRDPQKTAIVNVASPSQKMTYGDIYLQSLSVASFLHQNDFRHGSVAAVVLPNCCQYVPIIMGIGLTGGITTPASPIYTEAELTTQFNDSQAKIVFCLDLFLDATLEAVEKSPSVKKVVVLRAFPDSIALPENPMVIDYLDVKKVIPETDHSMIEINEERDMFILPYSSGTTGAPKGVMLTHKNLSTTVVNFDHAMAHDVFGDFDPPYDGFNESQLIFMPFYHIFGFGSLMGALNLGATIATMPKLDLELYCKTVQDYKIRAAMVVPPVMVAFAKHSCVDEYDMSSLEILVSGAAPLGKETIDMVKKRLPNLKHVFQGWGMTEVCMIATIPSLKNPTKPDSVGRLMPGFEMRIVDPSTGKSCNKNEIGEIWLRGKQIMLGYLNRPQSTAECLDDEGWLHTGDIGYADDTHQVFIVDRMKELIKVSGYQVPPAELESLMLTHPKIKDVAVIGIPNERKGEVPRAFVVKSGDVTEQEIEEFVASKVAPYKKLRGGVVFIDEIPKSPAGKILRRVLKEQK